MNAKKPVRSPAESVVYRAISAVFVVLFALVGMAVWHVARRSGTASDAEGYLMALAFLDFWWAFKYTVAILAS